MDVERIALPGIGLQHVFTTASGRRIGVITHRIGRRDLVVYRRDSPDTAAETVKLTTEEADGLAELLATTRIIERFAELERQVVGLVSDQIPIPVGSRYDGQPLAATQARSRTGASIVAVVRDQQVTASPRTDFVLRAGDVVVTVGSADASSM